MRIPPLYTRKGWQRFLSGFAIGTIFGWAFFLSLYGTMYEKQISTIKEQQIKISELKQQNKLLIEENEEDEDTPSEKTPRIKEIEITFENAEKLELKQLTISELRKLVLEEVNDLLKKDVNSVAETRNFVVRTIENKTFTVDDLAFKVKVKQLFILHTKTEIHLLIEEVS
ncbi:sporulation membrane protein YtrI [Pseudalkalibacillus caeni]|uniref:Sporulation membrane protein YtrI C-terminal domain-containing protein n=1 Tax=Exobacillus caeni TaxID=2574798 RepID=A0A5R9F9D9_9BACL|nr:sporulation membrane protein YtrI [Pseudalkalibacillus caeni]TLS39129.1 hypothetical protein FCL54_02110 [Pseudalkalibacillus caeni]